MDTTILTFEEFENQVMAAFDDWPIKCVDRSDAYCIYYSFEAVNPVGPEGNYCNGEWTVAPKWNPNKFAKA
jgi:hypothetical protein